MRYIFILYFLFSSASAFSTTDHKCKAVPVLENAVLNRARTVNFPDGRYITVIGHIHGDRQIYKIINDLRDRRFDAMTDADFESYLRKILVANTDQVDSRLLTSEFDKVLAVLGKAGVNTEIFKTDRARTFDLTNPSVLGMAQQDYSYLLSQLAIQNNQRIHFVGFEGTQETLDSNIPVIAEAQRLLLEEFNRRKRGLKVTNQEIKDLLLSSTNGNIQVFIDEPARWNEAPLVGTESSAVVGPYEGDSAPMDPLDQFEKAINDLIAADDAHGDPGLAAKEPGFLRFSALFTHLLSQGLTMNFVSPADLEKEIALIQPDVPEWLREPFTKVVTALRERVTFTLARNKAVAEALAKQGVNGLHFMGLDHFNDVVQNLEEICSQESNRTRP